MTCTGRYGNCLSKMATFRSWPGMTLAAAARSFEDIPELDFRRPDQDPDEIDIAALADAS